MLEMLRHIHQFAKADWHRCLIFPITEQRNNKIKGVWTLWVHRETEKHYPVIDWIANYISGTLYEVVRQILMHPLRRRRRLCRLRRRNEDKQLDPTRTTSYLTRWGRVKSQSVVHLSRARCDDCNPAGEEKARSHSSMPVSIFHEWRSCELRRAIRRRWTACAGPPTTANRSVSLSDALT